MELLRRVIFVITNIATIGVLGACVADDDVVTLRGQFAVELL